MFTINFYRYVLNLDETLPTLKIANIQQIVYSNVDADKRIVETLEHAFYLIQTFLNNSYGFIEIPELKMKINNKQKFVMDMIGHGIRPVYGDGYEIL